MDALYITAFKENDQFLSVNLETFITLFVYDISQPDIKLNVTFLTEKSSELFVTIDFTKIPYTSDTIPEIANSCVWPVIVCNKNVTAGLCSVARKLIKSSKNEEVRKLLGFREACLMACTESSIWTRFCEIDITTTIKKFVKNLDNSAQKFVIPEDIARFEYHMSQPVRVHNVYKVARQKNNDKEIKSSVPIEQLNLDHTFGEGPFMTLADVILYPSYKIFFDIVNQDLNSTLSLTRKWYDNMNNSDLNKLAITLPLKQISKFDSIILPQIEQQSLYTADPTRYRPEKRIYTKQNDIESSLHIIDQSKIEIVNDFLPFGYEINFDWSEIGMEANPHGGALPAKRADRKCEQLENLAKAVVKLTGNNKYVIVDFCSGSGHLGILLAFLLPTCEIVLVENKERSLDRAKERISKMKLNNVTIMQCNLDYFVGSFDIGVSLHACGVATDLVIQNCINNKAHFVSCPCCYGGIRDCYHLKYPRSKEFSSLGLTQKQYLSLAHAADQTHDKDNVKTKQGYLCMDIIDSDRKFYAEKCGYHVYLGKLQPTTCTNKNNLLVGIYKG